MTHDSQEPGAVRTIGVRYIENELRQDVEWDGLEDEVILDLHKLYNVHDDWESLEANPAFFVNTLLAERRKRKHNDQMREADASKIKDANGGTVAQV